MKFPDLRGEACRLLINQSIKPGAQRGGAHGVAAYLGRGAPTGNSPKRKTHHPTKDHPTQREPFPTAHARPTDCTAHETRATSLRTTAASVAYRGGGGVGGTSLARGALRLTASG